MTSAGNDSEPGREAAAARFAGSVAPSLHRFISFSPSGLSTFPFPSRVSSLFCGAREVRFPHGVSHRSLCPAVGSARSCTLRELCATLISRARSRARILFQFDDTRGSRIGNERLALSLFVGERCLLSARVNSPPLLFALSSQHRRRESGENGGS